MEIVFFLGFALLMVVITVRAIISVSNTIYGALDHLLESAASGIYNCIREQREIWRSMKK